MFLFSLFLFFVSYPFILFAIHQASVVISILQGFIIKWCSFSEFVLVNVLLWYPEMSNDSVKD